MFLWSIKLNSPLTTQDENIPFPSNLHPHLRDIEDRVLKSATTQPRKRKNYSIQSWKTNKSHNPAKNRLSHCAFPFSRENRQECMVNQIVGIKRTKQFGTYMEILYFGQIKKFFRCNIWKHKFARKECPFHGITQCSVHKPDARTIKYRVELLDMF